MRMSKLGKTKRIKERKLALVYQINQLKTQLGKIKRRDCNDYSYASLEAIENTASSHLLEGTSDNETEG